MRTGSRTYAVIGATGHIGNVVAERLIRAGYQVRVEEAEKAMLATGMKPDVVRLFIELDRGLNDGLICTTQPMTQDHLGSTSIEDFAQDFAAAFRAATRI